MKYIRFLQELGRKDLSLAAPGVGEALVQGEIVPDQWRARRCAGNFGRDRVAALKVRSDPDFCLTAGVHWY